MVKKDEVKLNEPKPLPLISQNLDDVAVNSLMKKSIEDIINHWKNELDNNVDKFKNSSEKLKEFELLFQKNFETVKYYF